MDGIDVGCFSTVHRRKRNLKINPTTGALLRVSMFMRVLGCWSEHGDWIDESASQVRQKASLSGAQGGNAIVYYFWFDSSCLLTP